MTIVVAIGAAVLTTLLVIWLVSLDRDLARRMDARRPGAAVTVLVHGQPSGTLFPGYADLRVPVRAAQTPVALRAALAVAWGTSDRGWLASRAALALAPSAAPPSVIAATLLDLRYPPEALLEIVLNETCFGKRFGKPLCGFGTASRTAFGRPIDALDPARSVLLVAMALDPAANDPRAHPESALKARNAILDTLHKDGVLNRIAWRSARAAPLGLSPGAVPAGPFPGFLALVHDELRRHPVARGTAVRATLDAGTQSTAQAALTRAIERIEREKGLATGVLEATAIVIRHRDGAVRALVSGRDPNQVRFARALDIRRHIGSLVKPAVYLAALSDPARYTLETRLDDRLTTVRLQDGSDWTPENFDLRYRGTVTMRYALTHSLNVPTVRLGLDIGLPRVVDTLHDLGLERDIDPFPSLLLGAIECSPWEVAQLYTVLASDRGLGPTALSGQGDDARRTRRRIDPAARFLVRHTLTEVVRSGTAAELRRWLPPDLGIAGKTGTTNDLRDSWFAGFDGSHLIVVWLGRDDYQPVGLTGAEGAMRIFAEILNALGPQRLELRAPIGASGRH